MERVPMTVNGLKMLQAELDELLHKERPAISKEIEEARAQGDLSENAEYQYAKDKQGMIEGRIAELKDKIGRAQVIDPTKLSGSKVMMGATVEVYDVDHDKKHTYALVGPDEADIDKGLISVSSPLGRALIGKEKGEEVTFRAPNGQHIYEIEAVEFKEISV